jgi:hypothetical protein
LTRCAAATERAEAEPKGDERAARSRGPPGARHAARASRVVRRGDERTAVGRRASVGSGVGAADVLVGAADIAGRGAPLD